MATIRYFAAAAEAAGMAREHLGSDTLGELLEALEQRPGLGKVLPRCAVLIDGVNSTDRTTPLPADAVVDVLPPFAGG